jgi:hypothetical protein
MGPRQWFAFDSETGNGAGFIVISNPDELVNQNAIQYFRAVTSHVIAAPQKDQNESQQI